MGPGVRSSVGAVSSSHSQDDVSALRHNSLIDPFKKDCDRAIVHAKSPQAHDLLRAYRQKTGQNVLSKKEENTFLTAFVIASHAPKVLEASTPGYHSLVAHSRTLTEAFSYDMERGNRLPWTGPLAPTCIDKVLRPCLQAAHFAPETVDAACASANSTEALLAMLSIHANAQQRWDFLHAVLTHTPVYLPLKSLALALVTPETLEQGEKNYFEQFNSYSKKQEEEYFHQLGFVLRKKIIAMHSCEDSNDPDMQAMAPLFKEEIDSLCKAMVSINPQQGALWVDMIQWETRRVVESISDKEAQHAWFVNPSFRLQKSTTPQDAVVHDRYFARIHRALHSTPVDRTLLQHTCAAMQKRLLTLGNPSDHTKNKEETRANIQKRQQDIRDMFSLEGAFSEERTDIQVLEHVAECIGFTLTQLKDMVAFERMHELSTGSDTLKRRYLHASSPEEAVATIEKGLHEAWKHFDQLLLDHANTFYVMGDHETRTHIAERERAYARKHRNEMLESGLRHVFQKNPSSTTSYMCATLLSHMVVDGTEEAYFPETFSSDTRTLKKVQHTFQNIRKAEACAMSAASVQKERGLEIPKEVWDAYVQDMVVLCGSKDTSTDMFFQRTYDFLNPFLEKEGVSLNLEPLYEMFYGRMFSSLGTYVARSLHKGFPVESHFHTQKALQEVLVLLQPVYESQWMIHHELYQHMHQKMAQNPVIKALKQGLLSENEEDARLNYLVSKQQRMAELAGCFTCIQSFIQKIPSDTETPLPSSADFTHWLEEKHLRDHIVVGIPHNDLLRRLLLETESFLTSHGVAVPSLKPLEALLRKVIPQSPVFSIRALHETLQESKEYERLEDPSQKAVLSALEHKKHSLLWASHEHIAHALGIDIPVVAAVPSDAFFKPPQEIGSHVARACLDGLYKEGLPFSTASYHTLCERISSLPPEALQRSADGLKSSMATPLAAFFLTMASAHAGKDGFYTGLKETLRKTLVSLGKEVWFIPVEERVSSVLKLWETLSHLEMKPFIQSSEKTVLEHFLRHFTYDPHSESVENIVLRCLEQAQRPLQQSAVLVAQKYIQTCLKYIGMLPAQHCFQGHRTIAQALEESCETHGVSAETLRHSKQVLKDHEDRSYAAMLQWAFEVPLTFEERFALVNAIKRTYELAQTTSQQTHPAVKTYYKDITSKALSLEDTLPLKGVLTAFEDDLRVHTEEVRMFLHAQLPQEEARKPAFHIHMKSGFESA